MVGIRGVKADDYPQIGEIAKTAFRLHRFWTDRDLERMDVERYYGIEVEGFRDELSRDRDGFEILVADEGGQILGYIVLKIDRHLSSIYRCYWGIITSFALRPDSRGKGVGTLLLERALQWFQERGTERIDVLTDSENIAAIQCYEKQGFRTIYSSITLTKKL